MKLTGSELATQVKANLKQGLGLSACAVQAGYSSPGPNGNPIPAASTFMKELLKAEGYEFPTSGRGGRSSGDTVNVMGNNTVMLSPSRCKQANILPGDEIEIIFNQTDRSYVLRKKEKPDTVKPQEW